MIIDVMNGLTNKDNAQRHIHALDSKIYPRV